MITLTLKDESTALQLPGVQFRAILTRISD
jgi:hypothetical protein